MNEERSIVGTWRLVRVQHRTSDGQVTYPYGSNPLGYISYSRDGYMSVSMAERERPNFAVADLAGGTVEERAAAAGSYVAYCGRYELRGDSVVHKIEMSLFPNWTGTEQVRRIDWEGERLVLVSTVLRGGLEREARVVWERAR